MTECGKCKKEATHEIKNYFIGQARVKFGPNLPLCDQHAKSYRELHPFEPAPVKKEPRIRS